MYAVTWKTTCWGVDCWPSADEVTADAGSWHVMLTGTRSSETWDHLTEPELDVVTWNTSAHNLQMGIALKEKVIKTG